MPYPASVEGVTHLTVLDRGHELSGVVRPGESWAAAARRTAGSMTGEPVPLDLSGEIKRFQIDHDLRVVLRAMTRGDLPDVARWRSSDHVRRWFSADGPPDLDTVTERYGPGIDGMSPTRMWVVEVNGRSVGFCQDYRIRRLSGVRGAHTATRTPWAVDYAIGDERFVSRGIGTRMLGPGWPAPARRYPDVTAYFSAPDHRNTDSSCGSLEKVGFAQGTWFDEPQSDGSVGDLRRLHPLRCRPGRRLTGASDHDVAA